MNKAHSSNQLDMTQGPIVSKLIRFSVPLILSSILQLLFNAADIVVVGRFAGDNSLAAVGSTTSLINLLVNLFIGLSIGTNVVAASFFGAGKKRELSDTVHTAMMLSVISGIILTVVGVIGAKQILRLMQSPEEVLKLATVYLQIYFGGITATMIYNFGSALLRAKGDTKRPLYILFVAGLINAVLNLIFVIFFHLDVAGVALATVISQCIAAAMIVYILLHEEGAFKLYLKRIRITQSIFIRIIKIGVPAGFQGIIFSLSNVIIQSAVNSFGPVVIAGNSAAISLEGFVYTAMNGFSQGTLTFTSQNIGAGRTDRIKKAVIASQVIVLILGEALGAGVVLGGKILLGLFSTKPEVIAAGMIRLEVICSTYALCGMMDAMGNSIRGTGHSVLPMAVTIGGVCGIRLVWLASVFQAERFHNTFTIYLSYPISWTVTLIAHFICFCFIYKKMIKKTV